MKGTNGLHSAPAEALETILLANQSPSDRLMPAPPNPRLKDSLRLDFYVMPTTQQLAVDS